MSRITFPIPFLVLYKRVVRKVAAKIKSILFLALTVSFSTLSPRIVHLIQRSFRLLNLLNDRIGPVSYKSYSYLRLYSRLNETAFRLAIFYIEEQVFVQGGQI